MEVAEKKRKRKKKMQQLFFVHTTNPNNIPNAVIIEILSWLPAKSLLRLRWTCKYWFDLITRAADGFIKIHLHHSTIISHPSDAVLSFYCMNYSRELSRGYDLDYYLLKKNYFNYNDSNHHMSITEFLRIDHHPFVKEHIHEFLGSSNGLILLMLSNKYLHEEVHLCILNPCTREYRVLRRPLNPLLGEIYGFGYDETIDDYKVVRVLHSEVEVYTLGEDSWRWIGPCPYRLSSSAGVFLNGALCWIDFGHENIISFDMGKEEFQPVAKTPNLIGHGGHPHLYKLQVFEGSLGLVLKAKYHPNSLVEIWVMKEYTVTNNNNKSLLWTKLLTIPDVQYFSMKPIRYTKNGEILILNNNEELVLYNPNNTSDPKTLHRIKKSHFLSSSVLEVYTESLVCLNSRTYAR